jgi:hypothetical protein
MELVHERIVEVPFFKQIIKDRKNILEIGNVLSNYDVVGHMVVDKYEPKEYNSSSLIPMIPIAHKDIETYGIGLKFDIVISISTFEHIGYEAPEIKDNEKIVRVIKHIKENLLTKCGDLWFSFPTGFNKNLDELIRTKKIQCTNYYCFQRYSEIGWTCCQFENVNWDAYDNPYGCGNCIVICRIKNES